MVQYLDVVVDSLHQPREEAVVDGLAQSISSILSLVEVTAPVLMCEPYSFMLTTTSSFESGFRTKSRVVSTLLFVRHSSSSSTEQPSMSQAYLTTGGFK